MMASIIHCDDDTQRPSKRPRESVHDSDDKFNKKNVGLSPVSKVTLSPETAETDVPPFLDFTTDDSNSFFAALIHPLSPTDFLNNHFRKGKALHVSSPGIHRLEPILEAMEHLDPSHILRETSSESVFVWLLTNHRNNNKRMIESIEVDNFETALSLYRAGHATYCRASPQVEQPLVRHMLRATGMGCGQYDNERSMALGRGEVEVFMTPSSEQQQHTTDWHYDFQENFTLQLSGSKRWSFQRGVVEHPMRGCTPHYAAPEAVESQLKAAHLSNPRFEFGQPKEGTRNAEGVVDDVVLQPGDILYHPAGIWHKVEVLEPGVSINISLMATNYATVTCQALQHFLLKKAAWRESLVSNGSSDTSFSSSRAPEQLDQLLDTHLLNDVKEFIAQCGAGSIVPPVLSKPVDSELLEQDEGEGETTAVADGDESDEEQDEPIIDVNRFNSELLVNSCTSKLRVNPLASLLRMNEDILGFYEADEKMKNVYVLNVNYAGNDMHESAVRVLLRDEEKHLERYVDTKRSADLTGLQPLTSASTRKNPNWQHCLIFYGFLIPS